eukprot:CAMPEP_0171032008 /NCGR_PEP_ID=MMETSP0736-20130129/38035_1 /TAXON_ID=186038 /ORGANISM="Fragilariopsis kerguelensis, Strain L26-C5" /LENGTH=361 /DNA_ID=CAMNT_0011474479 /DNA_START=81 /DNA_END=1166 /DNA_ORIENTATION=+
MMETLSQRISTVAFVIIVTIFVLIVGRSITSVSGLSFLQSNNNTNNFKSVSISTRSSTCTTVQTRREFAITPSIFAVEGVITAATIATAVSSVGSANAAFVSSYPNVVVAAETETIATAEIELELELESSSDTTLIGSITTTNNNNKNDINNDTNNRVAVGKKAPDFELENARGNGFTTSLEELIQNGNTNGYKWTVLYFYPGGRAYTRGRGASTGLSCTLEARCFQRDLAEYKSLKAQIVGVSVNDSPQRIARFSEEENLEFCLLSDKGGVVSKQYGDSVLPHVPGFATYSPRQTYIIDNTPNTQLGSGGGGGGELRWIFTNVEPKIARHSSEVLAKLTELEEKTTTTTATPSPVSTAIV